MKNTKKGFTLVELLVVIAILAILASVAVVGYSSFLKKADESNAKTELHQIVTYVNAELMDDGKWSFTVVTTPAAEGVAEVKTTYTVVDKNGTLEASYITDAEGATKTSLTIDAVIKACPDFADLFAGEDAPTLTATADGKTLTYTYGDGKATATLD